MYAAFGDVELLFDLPTQNEKKAFNPMDHSCLDAGKLYRLGWTPLFDAETGIKHTINVIKEMMEE